MHGKTYSACKIMHYSPKKVNSNHAFDLYNNIIDLHYNHIEAPKIYPWRTIYHDNYGDYHASTTAVKSKRHSQLYNNNLSKQVKVLP